MRSTPGSARSRPARLPRSIGLLSIPLLALALRAAVVHFDWNFLLQKLGVSLVWALAIGWGTFAAPRVLPRLAALRHRTCDLIAVLMVIAGLGAAPLAARAADWSGTATLEPDFVLDRYAALDASYQLLRSLIRTNAGADAEFYSFLKAHSTLGSVPANPVDVKLVDAFQPKTSPPHVFLFIVDSLRRDYLSPYNPRSHSRPPFRRLRANQPCSNAPSPATARPACRCRRSGPAACCCISSTSSRSRR